MRINRQDTNGVKPLLQTGELGFDNFASGGDKGRVYVGDGTVNIALAKKSEVDVKVVANVDITAGTATKVTYDAKGLVTSGTNPTTLAGYGIGDAYTKAELDAVNVLRADKVLASKDVANMIYSAGNLVKIRYTTDVDVDYEVLTYSGSDLVNVAHYVDSVFKGDTVLTYSGGELVSSIFVGV